MSMPISAVYSIARANAALSCRIHLISGREFDGGSAPHGKGAACADCDGCESRSGEMGMVDAGFALVREHGTLKLTWTCPGCGVKVSETTSPLSSLVDAKLVAADALCHRCRIHPARKAD